MFETEAHAPKDAAVSRTKPVNPYQQINHPARKSLRLLFKLLQPCLLDCLDLFLDDLQPLHVPSKGGANRVCSGKDFLLECGQSPASPHRLA